MAVPRDGPPPEALLGVLAPEEPVLAFAWARVQKFGTPFGTLYPIGTVIRAVDVVRNRRRMAQLREATLGRGFPLERTMAMLVTRNRLLIWAATRHPRRVGELLGEVPQSRIAAAKIPFSNSGPWRTVRLWLTDTTRVQFQVDATSSDSFVAALDKSGTN